MAFVGKTVAPPMRVVKSSKDVRVRVAVRVRPLLPHEQDAESCVLSVTDQTLEFVNARYDDEAIVFK